MSPDADLDRRRRAIEHIISVCAGWSPRILSGPGTIACKKGSDIEAAICFDVKSGNGPVRYDSIYVVGWPQDPRHIHIVPGQVWFDITKTWPAGWEWTLWQCAVELEDVPAAVVSLIAASKSTQDALSDLSSSAGVVRPRKWYRNPSNNVEFDGWCVPPPLDITRQFTHINKDTTIRISERSIQRLWDHLDKDASLDLYDNPFKPMIADFVLTFKDPQTDAQRHVFVEHKASFRVGKKKPLEPFLDAKYNWHVLISQEVNRQNEHVYRLVFAGGQVPQRYLEEPRHMHATMKDRWGTAHRDDPNDEMVVERIADGEPDQLQLGSLDMPNLAARGDDDDDDPSDEEGEEEPGSQGANRQWRVRNGRVEIYARNVFNDQSWYMGQNMMVPAFSGCSHGTSVLVEQAWTEQERAAYAISRTLPRPALDSKQIPITFGRRLYETPTGERQYLKASVRKYDGCSKIRTLYVLYDSVGSVDSLEEMQPTLHCTGPAGGGRCSQCDEEHEHVQHVRGSTSHRFPAGYETHRGVVDRVGKFRGTFGLKDGRLWQRCAELFSEEETYEAYTFGELLQSTWKHGLRSPKDLPRSIAAVAAAAAPPRRWAPCNACWAARRLCDTSRGTCSGCRSSKSACVRKRCVFFADPEACADPNCSEVHNTDGYNLLTEAPRNLDGGDRQKDAQRDDALKCRIPVCNNCWSNGWHLLCSKELICYMCKHHNKEGSCTRTRCSNPLGCDRLKCAYAHSDFHGSCEDHEFREPTAPVAPGDLDEEARVKIAKERGRTLKTIANKASPYTSFKRVRKTADGVVQRQGPLRSLL
ncbi:uncharacterized protein N0V89_011795 [Didymosphaeria variabile]|uniref:Uncharacterized protein n=1 Tax=Didymosphaeria variabile TaxID=1932322 RepID=A0A9W9C5P7_9PLEO|nr:uncharacterized protein N0V89_011795 [Didymosphaeria variabile]KAJ4345660.1 hypothetical protein N0V89_011795 [Didymosphaeria variabile]